MIKILRTRTSEVRHSPYSTPPSLCQQWPPFSVLIVLLLRLASRANHGRTLCQASIQICQSSPECEEGRLCGFRLGTIPPLYCCDTPTVPFAETRSLQLPSVLTINFSGPRMPPASSSHFYFCTFRSGVF